MIQLNGIGRLERCHFYTLWIETTHDMFDSPIFTARIHGLEDDQDAELIMSIKDLLHFRKPIHTILEQLDTVMFTKGLKIYGSFEIFKFEVFRILNLKFFKKAKYFGSIFANIFIKIIIRYNKLDKEWIKPLS